MNQSIGQSVNQSVNSGRLPEDQDLGVSSGLTQTHMDICLPAHTHAPSMFYFMLAWKSSGTGTGSPLEGNWSVSTVRKWQEDPTEEQRRLIPNLQGGKAD